MVTESTGGVSAPGAGDGVGVGVGEGVGDAAGPGAGLELGVGAAGLDWPLEPHAIPPSTSARHAPDFRTNRQPPILMS